MDDGVRKKKKKTRVRLALKPRFLSKGLASQSVRICVFVAYSVGTLYSGQLNSIYSMQLNRSIPNLRAADIIKSRLNLVRGNLSKVSLHMRSKHGIDTIQLS